MEFLTPVVINLIAKIGIIVIDLFIKGSADRKRRYRDLYIFINSKFGELDSSKMRKGYRDLKERLDESPELENS